MQTRPHGCEEMGFCGDNLASGNEAHLGRKSARGNGTLSRLLLKRQGNFRELGAYAESQKDQKGPFAKACRICGVE